jgi:tripeptidyl-peptidase I
MLNDQRLSKGLPPLGFVNPRLYQIAASNPGEAFYDVTDGNSACASDGSCCSTGFPASQGWDPTTGLGSPLWPGLIKYLLV